MDDEDGGDGGGHSPDSATAPADDPAGSGPDGGRTGGVLFVCEANVCRSRLMEIVFRQALGSDASIPVSSAGVAAHEGLVCDVVVTMASGDARPEVVAVLVDVDAVDRAELAITATTQQRSDLAKLSPSARTRTFTLREAVLLGERPLDAAETAQVAALRRTGQSDASVYATLLNSRRGTVVRTPPKRFARAAAAADDETPDVHQKSIRHHRAGLHQVRADTKTLHAQFVSTLAAAGRP